MSNVTTLSDRIPGWAPSAGVAAAAGLAGVLGSYGAVGFTPGYVVAPVESLMSRSMPGAVISFAITVLGDLGQQLNLAFATSIVAALFGGLAWVGLSLGTQLRSKVAPPVATAALVWAMAAAITLRPVAAVWPGVAAGLVVGVSEAAALTGIGGPRTDGNSRRRVVSALGTAVAAGAVGTAMGRSRTAEANAGGRPAAPQDGEFNYDVGEQLRLAEERSFSVGDTEPLVSEDFYKVDYSSVDPNLPAEDWTLSLTGNVGSDLELTYDDLQEMEHEHRFVTIRCVGESLNGHKIDNALWTGVPMADIIEEVDPQGECNCVMVRAEDDYYVQFPVEALERGMLAFGMNGRPLPRGHGAPVRALVPGHWGEVNVKWVTEMEFIDEELDGYWEKKGWEGTGPVKTVAKLHGRERTADGNLAVGGHAYAGLRGISAVEVSTDGGETWNEAELTDPLPGATGPAADRGGGDERAVDAWRNWRYEYEPPESEHEVVVRAVERDGTVQSREETGPVPDGAAGWVSDTVNPGRL